MRQAGVGTNEGVRGVKSVWMGTGAQPRFWMGGGTILGHSTKRGPGVTPPNKIEKHSCDLVHYMASVAHKSLISSFFTFFLLEWSQAHPLAALLDGVRGKGERADVVG